MLGSVYKDCGFGRLDYYMNFYANPSGQVRVIKYEGLSSDGDEPNDPTDADNLTTRGNVR